MMGYSLPNIFEEEPSFEGPRMAERPTDESRDENPWVRRAIRGHLNASSV